MIKLKSELEKVTVEKVRGGEGSLIRQFVFTEEETNGKVSMCAIQTIPPGSSVGVHSHDADMEIVHVLSGTVRVHDNGVEKDLVAGDSNLSIKGSTHGVRNVSGEDASMLCIIIK